MQTSSWPVDSRRDCEQNKQQSRQKGCDQKCGRRTKQSMEPKQGALVNIRKAMDVDDWDEQEVLQELLIFGKCMQAASKRAGFQAELRELW